MTLRIFGLALEALGKNRRAVSGAILLPTVLLVAHAGVFRVLRQHLIGADVPERAHNARPMAFGPDGSAGGWRVDAI